MKKNPHTLFFKFGITLTLTVMIMTGGTFSAFGASFFTDVPASHWAYAPIQSFFNQGYFKGSSSQDQINLYPDANITRGDFFVLLANASLKNQALTDFANLPFADKDQIPSQNREQIGKAYAANILTGNWDDGLLTVNFYAPITREEAFTLLGRITGATSVAAPTFADGGEISSFAIPYISGLTEKGIIKGFPGNLVYPSSPLLKCEAITLLDRLSNEPAAGNAQVKTFSGTGYYAYTNGPVSVAEYNKPSGITIDAKNNLIVVDTGNSLIRTIKNNTVSTLAGSIKLYDDYGDAVGRYLDAAASEAGFYKPTFAIADQNQNVYVSDTQNNNIRVISDGKVYTYAGLTAAGYKDGSRSEALFQNPSGMVLDINHNLYIADTLNHCIRKIDAKGNVTTFAGTGGIQGYKDGSLSSALFCEPTDIGLDFAGNLYVVDSGNQRVRKITEGTVTTLAGGGSDRIEDSSYFEGDYADGKGSNARFNFPTGLWVMPDGLVFVADTNNNMIRAISKNGSVTTVAGSGNAAYTNGSKDTAAFNQPTDLTYLNGSLYVADMFNSLIREIPIDITQY